MLISKGHDLYLDCTWTVNALSGWPGLTPCASHSWQISSLYTTSVALNCYIQTNSITLERIFKMCSNSNGKRILKRRVLTAWNIWKLRARLKNYTPENLSYPRQKTMQLQILMCCLQHHYFNFFLSNLKQTHFKWCCNIQK